MYVKFLRHLTSGTFYLTQTLVIKIIVKKDVQPDRSTNLQPGNIENHKSLEFFRFFERYCVAWLVTQLRCISEKTTKTCCSARSTRGSSSRRSSTHIAFLVAAFWHAGRDSSRSSTRSMHEARSTMELAAIKLAGCLKGNHSSRVSYIRQVTITITIDNLDPVSVASTCFAASV